MPLIIIGIPNPSYISAISLMLSFLSASPLPCHSALVIFLIYKIWEEYKKPANQQINSKRGKFFIFSQYFFVLFLLAAFYVMVFGKTAVSKASRTLFRIFMVSSALSFSILTIKSEPYRVPLQRAPCWCKNPSNT